MVLKTRIT